VLKVVRVAIFAVPLLILAGCHKEGPAEQAGKSIDKAGQSVKDAIDPPGPLQKAGRAIDNTTN